MTHPSPIEGKAMSQPATKLERTTAHLNLTTPLSVSDSREAIRDWWLKRAAEIDLNRLYRRARLKSYAGAAK